MTKKNPKKLKAIANNLNQGSVFQNGISAFEVLRQQNQPQPEVNVSINVDVQQNVENNLNLRLNVLELRANILPAFDNSNRVVELPAAQPLMIEDAQRQLMIEDAQRQLMIEDADKNNGVLMLESAEDVARRRNNNQ